MNTPVRIVLATRNPGKVTEMRALLEGLPVELLAVSDFPEMPEVDEDQPTLEGNARKKAETIRTHTGLPALADDTGLEVVALGGRPGVHSARYAGSEADDRANRAMLLRELEGAGSRKARFRTVIAYAHAGGMDVFEGVCEGAIGEEEHGTGGFGYDPVFVPEGETRTFAEMSPAEKNEISHRGQALRKLVAHLKASAEDSAV